MSSNAERLRDAVLARRTELDLTQLDVWQSGGPSNTTLTQIENGLTKTLTRTTAQKLDRALRWEKGSARAVWNGESPTSLGNDIAVADALAELERVGVDSETIAYIRTVLERDAEQRRERGAS